MFGNRPSWITESITRALLLYMDWKLDVAIVSYGRSNPDVRNLVDPFTLIAPGVRRGDKFAWKEGDVEILTVGDTEAVERILAEERARKAKRSSGESATK
jgi:hypothetical protein